MVQRYQLKHSGENINSSINCLMMIWQMFSSRHDISVSSIQWPTELNMAYRIECRLVVSPECAMAGSPAHSHAATGPSSKEL